LLILLTTALLYRTVWQRGFTDPDDFLEMQRALVTDAQDPGQIFESAHYGYMYRPINRLLSAVTASLGQGDANVFMLRNQLAYLVSIGLVFGIVSVLTQSQIAAALGAALFAFHPANVNVTSVAIVTHSVEGLFVLFAIFIVCNLKANPSRPYWIALAIVTFFLVIVTFSSETFLWVLPTFAFYLAYKFYKGERHKNYLVLAGAAIVLVAAYLVIRQSRLAPGTAFPLASDDRYSLHSPVQVLRNILMLFVGAGNVVDYVFFFNPVKETVPIDLSAMLSSGLGLSAALSLSVTVATVGVSGVRFVRVRSREATFSFVFAVLFLLSISIVSIASQASDTYLYVACAFLATSQSLLLHDWFRSFEPVSGRQNTIAWAGVFLIVAVLGIRALGVNYRNGILQDKAVRIHHMQDELRRATAGFVGDAIVFVPACRVESGYSVYGGRGIALVQWQETPFVQLTLANTHIAARVSKANPTSAVETSDPRTLHLFVDNDGNISATYNATLLCTE
jgi:hypothetical protein